MHLSEVKYVQFEDIDYTVSFFDSLRADYPAFNEWFKSKQNGCNYAYVAYEHTLLVAFLYLKVEPETEVYSHVNPTFEPLRRLKVGTYKIDAVNMRSLALYFDGLIEHTAATESVASIYFTVYERSAPCKRLIKRALNNGFVIHGTTVDGELVLFKQLDNGYNGIRK